MTINRLFAALIMLVSAACCSAFPAKAKFEPHSNGTSRNIFIFVHGLMGDKNSFKATNSRISWPSILETDTRPMRAGPPLSTYGSGYLLYETDASIFLSPKDISVRLTDSIIDAGVFDHYDNVFLVCHSLGGVICKELFLHLQLRRPSDARKIAGIFLFAVPSQGNPHVHWLQYIASLAGASNTVLEGLKPLDINPALDALEKNWGFAMGGRYENRPYVFCAYEKLPTPVARILPNATIVSQIYAATRCDEPARPENETHLSIVKPSNQAHAIHDWVRGRVGTIQTSLAPKHKYDGTVKLATLKSAFTVNEPIVFQVSLQRSSHLYCLLENYAKSLAVVLYPVPNREFKAMISGTAPITLNGSDFGYDSPGGFYDSEPGLSRFRCFATESPLPAREHVAWLVQHVVERKLRGSSLTVSTPEIEPLIAALKAHGAIEATVEVRVLP